MPNDNTVILKKSVLCKLINTPLYDIVCIDNGDALPQIQKCNLTLLNRIPVGGFIYMQPLNTALHQDYLLKATQITAV
ncbi:hypothetical protein [Psychroserpens sp. NJDZ02]|uniref:hypothetical protein n=1 Tax=Psychroserpens sp. NJDZ02 TaxID=2570561 RepID=UPI0010A751A8|nr:hypothetical protein [Psychroserpens sp. NJDZ02]QCE42295.1 hypothetical protein E9099_13080 [Psychroserpens sp. NJDZ02]